MLHPFKKMLMKRALYFLPMLILAGVYAGNKLEFWEKKDPSQWSQKECQKLLEDSPWVQQQTITFPWMETTQSPAPQNTQPQNPRAQGPRALGSGGRGPGAQGPGMQNPLPPKNRPVAAPVVRYTIQLRSALPILQAVQRLNEITGPQPGAPAPGMRGFGQMGSNSPIIVHILCKSDKIMVDWSMFNYWTKQSVDQMKDLVTLSGEKGDKVSVARYLNPFLFTPKRSKNINNEFEFIFPRQINGKELLSPDDEFLKLEFPHPNLADNMKMGKGPYDPTRGREDFTKGISDFTPCIVKFKTDKMKLQGNLVY